MRKTGVRCGAVKLRMMNDIVWGTVCFVVVVGVDVKYVFGTETERCTRGSCATASLPRDRLMAFRNFTFLTGFNNYCVDNDDDDDDHGIASHIDVVLC